MAEVWPFEPDPRFTETYRADTDIFPTQENEARWTRHGVMVDLSYRCTMESWLHKVAIERIQANPLEWDVPIWSGRSTATVVSADTTINCDTDSLYKDGGRAIVWSAWDDWTVVDISTVGSGVLNLSGTVGADHTNAAVMPLQSCYVPSFPTARTWKFRAEFNVTFIGRDVYDVAEDTAISSFPDLRARPVISYDFASMRSESGSQTQPSFVIDPGGGLVDVQAIRDIVENRASISLFMTTQAETWDMQQLLMRIRGSSDVFWAMDLGGTLEVLSYTATTVTIEPASDDPANYVDRFVTLGNGGGTYQVTAAVASAGKHVLTIGTHSATPAELAFLSPYRLAQDEIQLRHAPGVVRVQLPIFGAEEPDAIPWTPSQILCLEYWLDARRTSTLSLTGTAVDSWTDRANASVFSGSGATRPTYDSTAFSNLGGVTFASDYIDHASNTAQNQAVFGVFNTAGYASQTAEFYIADADSASNADGFYFGDVSLLSGAEIAGMSNGTADAERILTTTLAAIPSGDLVYGATQQTVLTDPGIFTVNGTEYTGTNTGNRVSMTGATLRLGASKGPARYFSGTIGEILVFSCPLTSDERDKLNGYLAHGWGLEGNLPGGHPYKTAAPTLED